MSREILTLRLLIPRDTCNNQSPLRLLFGARGDWVESGNSPHRNPPHLKVTVLFIASYHGLIISRYLNNSIVCCQSIGLTDCMYNLNIIYFRGKGNVMLIIYLPAGGPLESLKIDHRPSLTQIPGRKPVSEKKSLP